MAHITLYQCPTCQKTFNRRDNGKKHLKKVHLLAAELLTSKETNRFYVNPDEILPYCMDHRARLSRKRASSSTAGEALVSEGAVCRDEEDRKSVV